MIYFSIYLYGAIIFLSFYLFKIKFKFKNDENKMKNKLYEKIDAAEDKKEIDMIGPKKSIFFGAFILSLLWPIVILVILYKFIMEKKEN